MSISRDRQPDSSPRSTFQNARSETQAHDRPSFSATHRQALKLEAQRPSCVSSNRAHSLISVIPHSEFRTPHLFLRNWLHLHSGLQQLQTGRDNFLAVLQTTFHNPFSFEKTTSLEVTAFDGIVGLHDEYVFQHLFCADHSVREEYRPIIHYECIALQTE